jgi:hypothetical protein
MPETTDPLVAAARAVAALGDFRAATDADLLAAQGPISHLRGLIGAIAADHAGEVARRSARELGHSGLAQRNGFLNASKLIEAGSGITGAEATKLVAVGTLLVGSALVAGDVTPELVSWRTVVALAVGSATISIDAASSIDRGLAGIDDRVAAVDICDATRELICRASSVAPDRLFQAAREIRDRLDADGIAAREAERREQRYFSIRKQPDGMYRGSFLLAPEDGTVVSAAIDAVLSPRRGSPRFVDPAARAAAEKLLNDPRTNAQIAADAFADLMRLAIDADPNSPLGSRRPAVRVVVTADVLKKGAGAGVLEANADPISFDTIARSICDAGTIGVQFDTDGEIVNLGREQRLFSQRQRVGMAVRDGGCRFPECDRPPAWTEAHHIDQWQRDYGKTDANDGVLLCRRHHMLIHNNHWEIERDGATYWLRPPADVDPTRELIAMPGQARVLC